MKKILCVALAMLLALSLVACGKGVQQFADDGVYYFGSEEGMEKLQANPNPLNPTSIYNNATYTEQMLYGSYHLENLEKNREAFLEGMPFEEVTFSNLYSINTAEENLATAEFSVMPVGVEMGYGSCWYGRKLRDENHWATLYLMGRNGLRRDILCTYTVSGNRISFYPLAGYEEQRNEDGVTDKILYKPGTESIDYTFRLDGLNLTLSRDGRSVTLTSEYFSNNGLTSLYIGGSVASGSASFDGVDHFSATRSKKLNTVYIVDKQNKLYADSLDKACIAMGQDGKISMYWETEDEEGNVTEHLKHFVYFGCDGFTLVLTDGERFYYYTETSITRETVALGEGMTEEERTQLNTMDDSQIEQIVQKKADLLADLAAAYEAAGLNVSINAQTGEIALDSTVLFDYNASSISAEGQAFLQKFTQIYTQTVYSDKYADFVSRILVEGHTDTDGSYESNLALSQERADNVKTYCLSAECGVDSAYAAQFAQSVEAVGYSYDKPVYDDNGQVDMAASRRVAFRFVINLTQS